MVLGEIHVWSGGVKKNVRKLSDHRLRRCGDVFLSVDGGRGACGMTMAMAMAMTMAMTMTMVNGSFGDLGIVARGRRGNRWSGLDGTGRGKGVDVGGVLQDVIVWSHWCCL